MLRLVCLPVLALVGLVMPSSVAAAQEDAPDKAAVLKSIMDHYGAQDGFMTSISRSLKSADAPFMMPASSQEYGVLLVRPNRARVWEVPGEGDAVTLSPGLDTTGNEMIRGFGEPIDAFERKPLPENFEALLEESSGGAERRSVLQMMAGVPEAMSLMTERGLVVKGVPLSEMEYAGVEGEDTDLYHVFRGQTEPADGDPEKIEVRFSAVGEPWLKAVVSEATLRFVMQGSGEQLFTATMTNTFSGWRGIPRLSLTEGRDEVEDLEKTMSQRLQIMHGPGDN